MTSFNQLLQIIQEADLEDHSQIQALLKEYQLTQSQIRKQEIQQLIQNQVQKHIQYPFTENPPNNTLLQPQLLVLGQTHRKQKPYTLTENDLTQHLLTIGETGSGKTTFFRNTMTQLHTPFWAFDRKQDYRHLTTEPDTNLLVLPWKKLRLNPLKPPPGVNLDRWTNIFSIIFSQSFDLLTGSQGFLTAATSQLYTKYNLHHEQSEPYPSLYELTNYIRSDKISVGTASAQYKDRVYWRLHPLLLTVGYIFDCSQGYPVEHLMQRNVVFEIGGLNRELQRFIQQILFAKVYEYLLAQGRRDEGLQLLIYVDEAKQLFSVYLEQQSASGMPEIDDMMAKARQMGLGVAAADQEASKLTESVKANTKTKILLPVGDSKQFQAIAGSMNLSSRQRDYAQTLGTGQAVIQHGNTDPVPVDLHNHELEDTVSDQELEEIQKEKWNDLSYSERQPVSNTGSNSIISSSEPSEQGGASSGEPSETVEEAELEISQGAKRLLRDIAENPFKSTTERYEDFPSRYKGDKAKNELLEKGLIRGRKVVDGRKQFKLFEVTDRGEELLVEEFGIEFHRKGRGGIRHQYWQHQAKNHLEKQGWEAQLEKEDADVHAQQEEDRKIAVEIALGPNSREVEHVQKHLRNDFQTVVVACRNKQVQSKLQDMIDSEDIDEDPVEWIKVQSIDSLENHLQPE